MDAGELKKILNGYSDEELKGLKVVVETNEKVLGPTPTVEVKDVRFGFDWDKGKLILTPKSSLRKE